MASKKVVKSAVARGGKVAKAVIEKHMTSEEFKLAAKTVEARMGAIISAETGEVVKGTNLVQALGQGQLAVKVNGHREVTAPNQLKGAFSAFDGKNSGLVTRATFGADYPLDSALTRNGLARWLALHEYQLCTDPADQEMIDTIVKAIAKRYPEAVKVTPTATRKARGAAKEIANPNPLFA